MRRILGIGAGLGLAAGAYALLARPRLLRWGATEEEVRGRLLAEDVLPRGRRTSTMAVTLDAPPAAVWPWLVQMGYGRGGWYSWDRLDHFGIPSARTIHPEWQSLEVGQRLPATPDGRYWFDVAAIEPERLLALRVLTSGGRQYDSSDPRIRSFADYTESLWAFQLEPLPGGRTRVVVTVHSAGRPRLRDRALALLFWEPAHFVMQVRQLQNLRRRAEALVHEARRQGPGRSPAEAPQPRG